MTLTESSVSVGHVELIKLVSQDWTSRGGQRWEIGKPVSIPKGHRGTWLCSDQVLHAYHSVEQALLMDSVHGSFGESGRVVRAVAPEVVADDGTKVGVHHLTLIEEVGRPDWWIDTGTRRKVQVQFAVLCARAVLHLYEDRYPNNDQPRKAIEAAEAYLAGKASAYAAAAAAAAASASAAAYAGAAAAYAAASASAYAAAASAYAAAAAAAAAYAGAAAAAAAANEINTATLAAQALSMVEQLLQSTP